MQSIRFVTVEEQQADPTIRRPAKMRQRPRDRRCRAGRALPAFSYLALVVMSPDNGMPPQTTPRPIASRKFKASILPPISANAACGSAASIETVS